MSTLTSGDPNFNQPFWRLVKSLGYAYPSSDTAEKWGFGKTGCWLVQVAEPSCRWDFTIVGAYASKDEAVYWLEQSLCPLDELTSLPPLGTA